jgi:hypothetical protein
MRRGLLTSTSISEAPSRLSAAAEQLANTYKQTFGKVSCGGG